MPSMNVVETDDVLSWVAAYERAWRAADVSAVETLFAPDAHYRFSPYEEPRIGHEAIRAAWVDDDLTFSIAVEPVAVQGRTAVVRLEVRYGDPVRQEYRDLWILRFADDGRVREFEEWAYWPGKPYTADSH
jgi:ketosteroid isomerase-like protein